MQRTRQHSFLAIIDILPGADRLLSESMILSHRCLSKHVGQHIKDALRACQFPLHGRLRKLWENALKSQLAESLPDYPVDIFSITFFVWKGKYQLCKYATIVHRMNKNPLFCLKIMLPRTHAMKYCYFGYLKFLQGKMSTLHSCFYPLLLMKFFFFFFFWTILPIWQRIFRINAHVLK